MGGAASTPQTFIEKAENPFAPSTEQLPDMGIAPETDAAARKIAAMAKKFGEDSMIDNGLDTGEQARIFAFARLRDVLADKVTSEAESLLSPWGKLVLTCW